MKVDKTMGPDKMHLLILRDLAEKVAKPLPIVLEKSCQSTEDPTDWKRGKVTLTFKKRNKEGTENYRSFSLTLRSERSWKQILLEGLHTCKMRS